MNQFDIYLDFIKMAIGRVLLYNHILVERIGLFGLRETEFLVCRRQFPKSHRIILVLEPVWTALFDGTFEFSLLKSDIYIYRYIEEAMFQSDLCTLSTIFEYSKVKSQNIS